MDRVKNIRQLLINELNLVADDHSILLTVIIAPVLYFFFLGSIYMYKDIEQVPFAVVDLDNTTVTREMTRLISSQQKVNVTGVFHDYEEGLDLLNSFKVDGFLVFPKGFERDLKRLEGADVKLYLNNTRFLPSNTLNESISKFMIMAGAGVRLKYFVAKGVPPEVAMEEIVPIIPELRPLYNPTNNYGDFLLPGLFILILHQTLLIGLGESFARKRSSGFPGLKERKGFTGIVGYLSAKTGYYFILYIAYFILIYTVVFPAFGLPVHGDLIALSLLSLLFLITVLFYTLFISSFFKSQIGYMEIMAFTSYPIFLISGYSWPVHFMPLPLQWISSIVPITPFLEVVRKLAVMGGGVEHITSQAFHLLILAVVSGVAVYFRFKYISGRMRA